MMDSKRITANNLEAKPTMQAIAKTMNTISDFEPAGFIIPEEPLPTATEVVAISKNLCCSLRYNDDLSHRDSSRNILFKSVL